MVKTLLHYIPKMECSVASEEMGIGVLSLGLLSAIPLAASAGCGTSTETTTTTDCFLIFCTSHTVKKTITTCSD
ncbi:MAG: hypothetical protein QOD51_1223 [Candidatus Eremiobacteraeota bacterium]|nr:hypothetical protein [Candidatus Eremiobacteraeota bacterium]